MKIINKIILIILLEGNILGRNFSEKKRVLTENGYVKISELRFGEIKKLK